MNSKFFTKPFLVIGLFLLFANSGVSQQIVKTPPVTTIKTAYTTRYADKWQALNDSIKAGWKTHSAKPSNNMVPDTFAYAFSEWTLFLLGYVFYPNRTIATWSIKVG
jgi:hypothetical protein